MIRIRIRDLAEAKDFKNAQVTARCRPVASGAQRLWKGEVEKISMQTLNRLCRALECQPGDLFEYKAEQTGVNYVNQRSLLTCF